MFSSKNKRRYSKINYKKQIPLFKCGYMINENEAEIEKVRSHRYDINRPMPDMDTNIINIKCVSI